MCEKRGNKYYKPYLSSNHIYIYILFDRKEKIIIIIKKLSVKCDYDDEIGRLTPRHMLMNMISSNPINHD